MASMTLKDLRTRLADAQGRTFTLTGTELGVGASDTVFGTYLTGGTLTITAAATDPDGLTAAGSVTLPGKGGTTAVKAAFTAASDDVGGYTLTFPLASGWTVTTSDGKVHDYSTLQKSGTLTSPALVLRGQESTGSGVLTCTSGDTPYAFALDGSGTVTTPGGLTLGKAAKAFGFGMDEQLDIELTDLWIGNDPSRKATVITGSLRLSEGHQVAWVAVLQWLDPLLWGITVVTADLGWDVPSLSPLAHIIPSTSSLVVSSAGLTFVRRKLESEKLTEFQQILRETVGTTARPVPTLPDPPLEAGAIATLGYKIGGIPRDGVKVRLGALSKDTESDDTPPDAKAEQHPRPASEGPLRLDTVSLGYEGGTMAITMDLTFALGPIVFQVYGLGLAYCLKGSEHGRQKPTISGLGVEVRTGPAELLAALRYRSDDHYDPLVEGAGLLTLPSLVATVVGAYARPTGDPFASFFLFGSLSVGEKNAQGLGPPWFRVKGICLGGGYNSQVRLPGVAEIDKFPLLRGVDDPALFGGNDPRPMDVLNVLTGGSHPWVKPDSGEYWIAGGLRASIVEFVDLRAILLVEFGNDLVVSLDALGVCDLPREPPQKAAAATGDSKGTTPTMAHIELAASASYVHSQGLLQLSAELGNKSWVVSKYAKLTGGLAVCSWIDPSPHHGDFVLSFGGYHPAYDKPDWYPAVPRLGLNWTIDDKTHARGEVYATVTPNGLMFGGSLALVYETGAFKAWLTAHLDGLFEWNPLYAEIAVGVSVGVQATVSVAFVHVTVSVEIGVDLDWWSPPAGGHADVHLWFLSWAFDFGDPSPDHKAVSWSAFQSQLPPQDSSRRTWTEMKEMTTSPDEDEEAVGTPEDPAAPPVWVATNRGFVFGTSAAVPATRLYLGTRQITDGSGTDGGALFVRPLRTETDSVHTVTVTDADGKTVDTSAWPATAVPGTGPVSLWGRDELTLDGPGLVHHYDGLRIPLPDPIPAPDPFVAPARRFATDPMTGPMPYDGTDVPDGPAPHQAAGTPGTIADQIADSTHAGRRSALYTRLGALGYAPGAGQGSDDPLVRYPAFAGHDLTAAPLLLPEGT
ncbi:DUF6603 domain-containing protein [Kitasatospora sp. NPDC006786]|uniref:DUF6603 domain-containing protein n=1 Tax=unclassified Kitasatospora TaxID=2633591 RepID=UPI003403541C